MKPKKYPKSNVSILKAFVFSSQICDCYVRFLFFYKVCFLNNVKCNFVSEEKQAV